MWGVGTGSGEERRRSGASAEKGEERRWPGEEIEAPPRRPGHWREGKRKWPQALQNRWRTANAINAQSAASRNNNAHVHETSQSRLALLH
uniref:Uncharacterized protein n=1 Tax=Oryza sativa subsp. japonica TaxID=39947 RepID=Q7Y1K5_ORYSJ|nr:hypothetical protein [Oryza sativa Japonica Group]AAR01699.1 hypothetical protein [Oryza sativa Japonica Group]